MLATTEHPLLEQSLETLSTFALCFMMYDDDMLTITESCGEQPLSLSYRAAKLDVTFM